MALPAFFFEFFRNGEQDKAQRAAARKSGHFSEADVPIEPRKSLKKALRAKRRADILFISRSKTSEGKTSEGKTSEGKTSEGKTSEGKTPEGKTTEGKTSEGKTSEGKTSEGKTSEGKTSEGKTSEGKTSEGKTSEGKTSEGKTSEGKTSEGKTSEGTEKLGEWRTAAHRLLRVKLEGGIFMCAVKKKLAALMLAAAMVLALFPAVLAEGDTLADAPSLWVKPGTTTQENINELWGEGTVEYTQNADGSYTMKLLKNVSMAISANISLGNQFGGAGDPMIILDLNGFDITGTSIVIANYANLTIRDSSAEKSGRVVYDGGAYMAAVNNVGHYMAVEGGTFVCNGAGSATYNAAISTAASVTTEIKRRHFLRAVAPVR